MSVDEVNLADIMEGRGATYRLLARLYREEVDQALLDEMCAMRYAVNTGNEDVDAGNRLFHSYLSAVWERTLTELSVDYTRVFLGNGVNAYSAAYPFESVHTSGKRLLMQDARDEILTIYRANNIEKLDSWKAGEDHIALELEFEELLTQRTLVALREGCEEEAASLLMTQYNFLLDHLISWTPMLFTEMEKFARTDFYRALALLTHGFLLTDRGILEELLADELAAGG
ncbi:MAG: molecular chaperone TorD family protein [Coriobacteriales bacterium]|jgi:TorA maturation chaperone TorD|nr:molecular chaperone TorD family protein [Coriobacteriales bacterium]